MKQVNLRQYQLTLLQQPGDAKIFLEGPAGSGKTTSGVARLVSMLSSGLRGDSILIIVPQRTLAEPYYAALREPGVSAGGMVSVFTIGGLAQRMVDLFWPSMSEEAGFAHPDDPPIFLTLETAQYYMARVVRPLLDEGLFESVTIDRNRLFSQIIDNLNKSAVVGFSPNQIGERLKSAWIGDPGQLRVYDDVQTSASRFRQYCLEHNVLDFSLQVEVFRRYLWPSSQIQDFLMSTYRHIIYDNVEEDYPVAHDLLREWSPHCDSTLLIFDHDAGYRRFLGADPQSAYGLKDLCNQNILFEESLAATEEINSLGELLAGALPGRTSVSQRQKLRSKNLSPSSVNHGGSSTADHQSLQYKYHRYYPEMLDWVTDCVERLVLEEEIPPDEIVILAPYLSGALRFSLVERLALRDIPARSHRPSRSLREEPATQCLLTLSTMAFPEWGISPSKFDVAYALVQAIEGMDLVRAQLLTEIVYRARKEGPSLSTFDQIRPEVQERITYQLGEKYERLRNWLNSSRQHHDEYDHFLSRIFGELLSQPGFGFHGNYDAGQTAANLIESVQKFRMSLSRQKADGLFSEESGISQGKAYLQTVQEGLIAAQYVQTWRAEQTGAVLLAPAYTFLMSNRSVEIQFWLDIASRGWFERPYQPLTHPYVLSRSWQRDRAWTDTDEIETGQEALYCLVVGLIRRCRRRIYLGLSELGEQGYEQRGLLLNTFQRVLREIHATEG